MSLDIAEIRQSDVEFSTLKTRSVLHRPKSDLIDKLGLIEPVTPEVTIDGLGPTWVSINWHYTYSTSPRNRRPKVRKHTIQIGVQTIELDREQRRALITNLQPNTSYELTVQAIQFSPTDINNNTSGNLTITNSSISQSVPSPTGSSNNLNANTALCTFKQICLHTLSSEEDTTPTLEQMLKSDINVFNIAEKQKVKEIISLQQETRDILHQLSKLNTQSLAKQKTLMHEYSELNERRKSEDFERSQIRIENKNLEDENHALEVQISKVRLQATKVAKYQTKLERASKKIEQIENIQVQRQLENEQALDVLEQEVNTLQTREAKLTQELKYAIQYTRICESECEQACVVLRTLKEFSKTATKEEKLALLFSKDATGLNNEESQQLEHEIEVDNFIESEWKKAQKMLEQQYVDAYLQNSEQKVRLQKQRLSQQHSRSSSSEVACRSNPLMSSTPSPPAVREPLMGNSARSLLRHPGGSATISNPPSLASLHSINPLPSMLPRQPASLSTVQTMPRGSYDPFVFNSPSVTSLTSYNTVPSHHFSANSDSVISPTAANDLLPSNLFQDNTAEFEGTSSGQRNVNYGAENSGEPVVIQKCDEKIHETSNVNTPTRSKSKDSSWIPWLSPHSKDTNRRTTSLFFGTQEEDKTCIEPKILNNDSQEEIREFNNAMNSVDSIALDKSSPKGKSSRFFHKSGHRSGSFVRRLSLFSRKDSEPKIDEEPQ